MSWHFLPELVGESSEESSWDGEPSARSRSTRIAGKCFSGASGTACFPCSPSGTISERFTGSRRVDLWMLSLRASRASPSASPESELAKTTRETFGPKQSGSFAKYDPDSASWKMSQASLLPDISDEYSETWPRAGTMRDGIVSQRLPLAPLTRGIGFGSWPTICASEGEKGSPNRLYGDGRPTLSAAVHRWPTPHGFSKDGKSNGPSGNELGRAVNRWPTPLKSEGGGGWQDPEKRREGGHSPKLRDVIGGSLNPTWVELLMGWPMGWTDLAPMKKEEFDAWFKGFSGQEVQRCGKSFNRKRMPNGRLQGVKEFLTQNHCSLTCANTRKEIRPKTYLWRARKHRKETCEGCGYKKKLVVHHCDQNQKNNDPKNLQTLCGHCHDFWHATAKRLGRVVAGRMPCLG